MTDVQSWLNKGANPLPDWAQAHLIGRREPNGSFMVRTKVAAQDAQARCLNGHMLIERKGIAYTRYPNEARALLAELEAADAPVPPALPISAAAKRVVVAPVAPKSMWPAQVGRPPSIENRHPSELLIDDSYQRSIDTGPSKSLIARIAKGWDWRMCMPLVVSNRDGALYVIDGQHRLAAAKMRGDIAFLPCCVSTFGSVADEAAMFTAMNRARRAINRLDDFHAAQAGADPDALAIAALIVGAGFTISRKTGSATWVPGEVAFTSAIGSVRRKHGDGIVRQALAAIASAFPAQRLVAGSSVFTAVCRLLVSPPPDFDLSRLDRALRKFDMQGWADFLKGANGSDDRAHKLREVLLMAYDEAQAA